MLYIILPAYNEGNVLERLLNDITSHVSDVSYRMLLVDDGSTDATYACMLRMKNVLSIEIIKHDINKGLGASLKDALLYLKDTLHDEDIVVTMDADGTHKPEYIKDMVTRITKQDIPLVIASRYARGGGEAGLSIARSLYSRIANQIMKNLFPIPGIRDYTSGYRAYSGKILRAGFEHYGDSIITENGFTCMAELLIKLSFIADNFKEISFILRYDLKQGPSKMPVLKTMLRYIYVWAYLKKVKRQIKSPVTRS